MLLKRTFLVLILLFIATVSFAQEGDKTLPGEGEVIAISNESIPDMLAQGDVDIEQQDLLLEVTFDDADDWETYEEDTRFVRVEDGQYSAEVEGNFIIWGQNEVLHDDVIIEVRAEDGGGVLNNGYGVMCRANEDNNIEGYHFWVSADGFGAIVLYEEDDGYTNLTGWIQSDVINQGEAVNLVHAVCVDEYLALYANGELIAEVEDDTYDEGTAGLSLINLDDEGVARARFDDLRIWEAED